MGVDFPSWFFPVWALVTLASASAAMFIYDRLKLHYLHRDDKVKLYREYLHSCSFDKLLFEIYIDFKK